MGWKDSAVEDLKTLERIRQGVVSMQERIEALERQYQVLVMSLPPVLDAASRALYADRLLDNLVLRRRLEMNLDATRRLVEMIEKGLSTLDEDERMTLENFYIRRPRDYMDRLMGSLFCEKANVYRIKDRALEKFTMSMYGIEALPPLSS